jgi:putative tryptophan/tyrosine transport system substrate-binding protein
MARAQQGDRVRRIGVLMPDNENDPASKTFVSAFLQALADVGWTDGRNVRMDFRWAGAAVDRMQALSKELVGLQPDIIVTEGTLATVAVQRETRARPILSPAASSRRSTSRAGTSPTSPSMKLSWQVSGLELLLEIAPGLERAAIMFNPDNKPSTSIFMPSLVAAWGI